MSVEARIAADVRAELEAQYARLERKISALTKRVDELEAARPTVVAKPPATAAPGSTRTQR